MQKKVNIQTDVLIPAALAFHKQDDELQQYLSFKRPVRKRGTTPNEVELPIGKALKGSIILHKIDSSSGLHYEQQVRIYRKNTKRSTAPILETRYSRVNVSKSRVTVTMSFPLCSDPQRLKARLQNFANIVIDESDEIAAMLNQEGDARVQEAWQTIDQSNEEGRLMEFGFFILGLGIGIAAPYALNALVDWMKNNPPKKLNNDVKNNQQLDRVYIEYNPKTRQFYAAVDGDFAGVALAIAYAMNTNEQFLRAVKLANTIRGMPVH